ncbi:MAG: hypothetical protein PHC85_00540 [Candidatus Pacebacteria bacterium]|nr:hypothetical protein [Candidatus Paceibacterota bacterium]
MIFNIVGVETASRILSHPTWDILAISFFLAVGFFYGLSAGKRKLFAILFAIYAAILIYSNFLYIDFLPDKGKIINLFLLRTGFFSFLVAVFGIIFSKTVFSGVEKVDKWWHAFVLSFLETGLLMSAIFQIFPAKGFVEFSSITENLFASDEAFFWWLILPIVALFIIFRKRRSDKSQNRP